MNHWIETKWKAVVGFAAAVATGAVTAGLLTGDSAKWVGVVVGALVVGGVVYKAPANK